jgi:hypothetical protein
MDANEKVRLFFACVPFDHNAHIFSVQRLSSVATGRLNPMPSHPFDHTDLQPNSAPHPSENVINVRIQMYGKLLLPNSFFILKKIAQLTVLQNR